MRLKTWWTIDLESATQDSRILLGVASYAALFLLVAWKSKQKRLRKRLRRKLNVYEFVTTTFSTWMNGNLHEPTCKCTQTCKTSDQPHCFITYKSFCVWFVSKSQQVWNQQTLPSKGYQGKGRLGWVLHHHALPLPLVSSSSFCVDLHATQRHKNSCESECFLPTIPLLMSPSDSFSLPD